VSFQNVIPSVSLITMVKAGASVGTATGFFYKRGDRLFLVTNDHVCTGKGNDPTKPPSLPDTLRLRLHKHQNDLTQNADYNVPLYSGTTRLWKNPPSCPTADVALVELNLPDMLRQGFWITYWEPNALLPANRLIHPGEDIFIIGYPHAFHDTLHNLPIFRNAMVASWFRIPFQGQPLFLTDANLHPGTSGSPVISKPKNAWVDASGNTDFVTGLNYHLLGVHSGTYSILNIPLGLGGAWYAELVEETAASF
jgi:hypothetical protein